MTEPKLIIHCITYNHELFIRQTLDGFVMQKTSFPFVRKKRRNRVLDRVMSSYRRHTGSILRDSY
jgi:hypothetical protein